MSIVPDKLRNIFDSRREDREFRAAVNTLATQLIRGKIEEMGTELHAIADQVRIAPDRHGLRVHCHVVSPGSTDYVREAIAAVVGGSAHPEPRIDLMADFIRGQAPPPSALNWQHYEVPLRNNTEALMCLSSPVEAMPDGPDKELLQNGIAKRLAREQGRGQQR